VLKMLIVDDDKFEREGVKFLVSKYAMDLEIAEADSGESALAYLEQSNVDILFTDIRMKGLDGLGLAEKVREQGWPIKVIFMSAYGEFEYAQKAIDLNAIRYILKPVQVSEFLKVLSQVIGLCEEEKQTRAQQERLEASHLIESVLQELIRNIQRQRLDIAVADFDRLFSMLYSNEHLTITYVKYICTEIVKALFEAAPIKHVNKFKADLESIYNSSGLNSLHQIVQMIMTQYELMDAAAPAPEGLSKGIEEVLQIIELDYATDLSIELLAEKVYLTPNYLSHLFKKQKGISLNKYLTWYRMEKAKEMLLASNRKIIDIAQEVGYCNVPYFSSLFKHQFGKTPSQFREEGQP